MIIRIPVYFMNKKQYVPVELQIRTLAMDLWASLEHELRYKSNRDFNETEAARLRLCSEAVYEVDREMQNIYQGHAPEYHV